MKFDDPSLLTAYLDGELDARRHRQVELAARSDPRLAQELARLTAVRDLIARGPRPALGESVADEVLQRIEAEVPGGPASVRQERRRRIVRLWGSLAAMAAGMMIAWSFQLLQATIVGRRQSLPPVAVRPVNTEAPASSVLFPRLTAGAARAAARAPAAEIPTLLAAEVVASVDVRAATATTTEDGADPLRNLLGQANVRRLVVTVEQLDDGLAARLDEVIRRVPRVEPNHARLRLAPGVVVDPKLSGNALIYALVLDETELANLRQQLAEALAPSDVQLESAPLATVALLAESADAEFASVPPRGTTLAVSPVSNSDILASRVGGEGAAIVDDSPARMGGASLFHPHPESLASREPGRGEPARQRVTPEVVPLDLRRLLPRLDQPGATLLDPPAATPSRQAHVYLIWVSGARP